ncbi:MAG: hypothetical protein E7430_01945 [Ruminococcaceae bacterium]|nr:hypothetical protein [Oscillospiraceae bacterium]
MKMNKLLALLLVLSMVFAVLAGCGKSEAGETAEEAPAEEAVSEAPAEEAPAEEPAEEETPAVEEAPEEPTYERVSVELPLFEETRTYTMFNMMPFFMNGLISDYSNDINTLRLLQEYCNIKIETRVVGDSVISEQFNLMCASGDLTDIIYGTANYAKGYDAAIEDEIIIDLYDVANEYAPNFMYFLNTDEAIRNELITDKGALPAIATIYKDAGCENGGILLRGDWLRELGLEEPKTVDELHDYIQTCINEYGCHGICMGNPMGNNKADDVIYGYAYDLHPGDYNIIDGEVVFSYLNDSYYDYISMITDWYADGTIYTDFYTASMGQPDKFFAGGKSPLVTATAANLATIESYKLDDYDYEILPIEAPKVNADDELHFSWTDTHSQIKSRDTWAISVACEDPEGIMMAVNYLFSEEGELMFNYGEEGYSFEYDEEGNPHYTELVTNNPDGLSYMDACFLFVSAAASNHMPGILDLKATYYYFDESQWNVLETFSTCDADGSYNMPQGVALSAEENEEYSSLYSDVSTYASSEIMKWVMGQAELTEESFQAMQDNIIGMGGDRMEELYQAAYERYLQK